VAGSLQRAWADPLVAADPPVAVIRRWAGVASLGWGLAVLVRLAVLLLPEGLDGLRRVGLSLSAVGVLAWLVVLVLVARWRPGRDLPEG
jgi:hypothetical protein